MVEQLMFLTNGGGAVAISSCTIYEFVTCTSPTRYG